jgi:outer membrane protein assembly factor BamB
MAADRTARLQGQGGAKVTVRLNAIVTGLALVALLPACGERELILPGERFDIRTPLEASVPVEGEAAPVQAPAAENRSVPVSLGAMSSGDWAQRGGNARHVMPHATLSAAPQRVWTANIGAGDSRRNRIAAAPVVEGGRVFTMDSRSLVTATSTAGATLWQADVTAAFDRGGEVSGGGLAAAGGRVFAATAYGELVALDAASGAVVWRQRVDAPITGAPAVDGGMVYVSGRDGSAWAVAAADGKVVWQVPGSPGSAGMVGAAAPAVADGVVVYPGISGDVMAVLRQGGGQKAWQVSAAGKRLGRAYALTPDVTGDPVILGSTIYAGTAAGRTVALSLSGGERIWSAGEGALGPIAAAGGSLFLVNDEARLVRLDAATGEVIWSVEMPYFTNDKPKRRKDIFAHYGPVLAGGRVITVSSDGLLRGFDPASGALVHTAEIPGGAASQPAVAGGTLFVVGGNGQLHAFR